MSLDQVIGIIGQIATWVTVLLIFLTLREMERQRKTSQKPELIIPKVPLYGYVPWLSELPIPTEWHNKEIKVGDITKRNFAEVRLYNIGFGAAKNINLNWEFDLPKIMQTIKDYCYQNSIPIVVSIKNNFLETAVKGKSTGSSMVNMHPFSFGEHEYLMPVSVLPRGLESYLPLAFMQLLSILVYVMLQADKASSKIVKPTFAVEFPAMKLHLKYEDVGGGKYKKEFDAKFLLIMIRFPKEGDDYPEKEKTVEGLFEFTEINV